MLHQVAPLDEHTQVLLQGVAAGAGQLDRIANCHAAMVAHMIDDLQGLIDAEHQCMTTRGVHHRHVSTITTQFTGVFKTDASLQRQFLHFVNRR